MMYAGARLLVALSVEAFVSPVKGDLVRGLFQGPKLSVDVEVGGG